MSTVDKWDNACRLCSEQREDMLPIFGNEGLQRKVAQKLRACLPVLVYKTDPLPKQICQFCAARLDDAYEFREYCLNVYKSMYANLLMSMQTESIQIFLDAMKNSPDPCQAQLCKEKSREPPPLVPLPTSMPFDDSVAPINQISQDQLQNACMETLPELPCEVEIKEMNADSILNTAVCQISSAKHKLSDIYDTRVISNMIPSFNMGDEKAAASRVEYHMKREEKRTSILEQVLTGSLTMNNRQKLQPRTRLTSEWWCTRCNSYYKTKDSLAKHIQLHCPCVYICRKCSLPFESVEALAKHEADSHLIVMLGSVESVKDCHQCDRQFISWQMLKQHRLRDHSIELTETGINTWCSSCNRSFLNIETYQNHIQSYHTNDNSILLQKVLSTESAVSKIAEEPYDVKRLMQWCRKVKSLTCQFPNCGKVCKQRSALSNHMRTHIPKKHKCSICGQSFGLIVRLAAHMMSRHNKQPTMSPIMLAVEQEEALNAEREEREAREAKTRKRPISELQMMEKSDIMVDDESITKYKCGGSKNVARCGICLEWFSDHTTMLTHLQTHSDNSCKSFPCHLCKKSFKEQWQLSRHETSHKRIANASYTCVTCNESFTDKVTYKLHRKTHTVDKTYHCAKCNKIFFKEVSLLAHQCTGVTFGKKVATETLQRSLSHSSDRRYKCSKCDATFSSSQSRNAHMKMHSDGTQGNTIQKHEIKIEADDESMPTLHPETSLEYDISPIEPKVEISEQSVPPPLKRTLIKTTSGYRCGVCQSPFVSRELAVAHLRSAHPVMPYQCPYCKKRFTTQYTFTHHIKTEHPEEPEK